MPPVREHFSFNLFEEYYDSDANEHSDYLTCTQRKNRRARLESLLQEMNDGGACLES